MAKQKNNIIMRSTRGMVGGQIVFKRRAGKAYVAAAPEVNENRVPTAGQLLVQEKFRNSVAFAKIAMVDADTKASYKAKARRGQTALNVAFLDAYYAPEVLGIITTGYTGAVGSPIMVQATDNFKVASVMVQIFSPADVLIEEGAATALPDGLNWQYLATVLNETPAGCKVNAIATDPPENTGTLQVTL